MAPSHTSWNALRWQLKEFVERERTHLTIGAVICAGLIILQLTGVFGAAEETTDRWMYQIRGDRATSNPVVMVLADQTALDRMGWPPFGPNRLVDALEAIREQESTSVAVEISPGLYGSPLDTLGDWCKGGDRDDTVFYSINAPPAAFPEDCRWKSAITVRGDEVVVERDLGSRTLVGLLASRAGAEADSGSTRINYAGPDGLPTVSLANVVDGNLPAELFRERTVVVANAIPGQREVSPTPYGLALREEVRAQAVATLIEGARMTTARWWPLGFVPLFVALGAWLARTRYAVPGLVGASGLWAVAEYVAFVSGVRIEALAAPVGGWSAFLTMYGLSTVRDEVREQVHDRLNRAVERTGAERAIEEGEDRGFWNELIERPLRLLPDTRMAVAELEPDDWWLEFRAFHETDEQAVAERRRDVRRPPYSDAIDERRPTVVDGYVDHDNHQTLLVPLIAQGQTRGFWFVHDPEANSFYRENRELIERIGEQMSQEIYWRQIEPAAPDQETGPGEEAGDVLESALAAMETLELDRRSLEDVVEHADVGLMMTNLFGEVVHENSVITEMLVDEEGQRFEYDSLAELIARLEETSVPEASETLREVLETGEPLRMSVELPGDPARFAEFRVSMIENEDDPQSTAGGLLMTGVDVTRTIEEQRQKLDLVEVIHTRASDLMSFATGYTDVLALSDGLGEAEREMVEGLQESLGALEDLIGDFSEVLNPPDDEVEANTPVAMDDLVRDAVRSVSDRVATDRITFNFPDEPAIARSHPPSLEKAVRMMVLDIEDFASDAGPGEVSMELGASDSEVTLMVKAPQMGLPNALVQRLIGESEEELEDEESRLVVAKSYVENAGGAFEALGSVDGGTTFIIRLPSLERASDIEPPTPF